MSDPRRFGYTPEQWQAMVDAGETYLETLARHRGHTDYTTFCLEVATAAGTSPRPGDHALAFLLGDIAASTYDSRGVAITAIVHYKDQGFSPGPGFYAICQDLGLLPAGNLSEDQKLAFLVEHQRAIETAYPSRRRGVADA